MGFPTAVSASGDVVVGYATGAMVWTAQRRAMSLQSLLGPTVPPGWTLSQGLGVSGDGLHVVGWGQNPMGRQEAWLTVLTPELLWCAANCDNSTTAPALNVNDFVCFLNKFAAGDTTANCDQSAALPSLNVNDFTCFLNAFRLYECFIDAIFSKAKGGGDGIGLTKAGKGVKVMVLVDARGLPVAVTA
ncbi:MAG: hypothetical protein ACKVW3_11660, partial [Phycisphaerales bacterium]